MCFIPYKSKPAFYPVLVLFCFLLSVNTLHSDEVGSVFMGVIINDEADPVIPMFLKHLDNLDYDKKMISLRVNNCNTTKEVKKLVEKWVESNKSKYKEIAFHDHSPELQSIRTNAKKGLRMGRLKNKYLIQSKEKKCDYCFIVSSNVFLAPCTLNYLLKKKKPVISPMLRPMPAVNDVYRNFWSDVAPDGFYKDHPDYYSIGDRRKVGTFQVPCVNDAYLIQTIYADSLSFTQNDKGYQFIAFASTARENQIDQFICNEKEFGSVLTLGNQSLKDRKAFALIESDLEITPSLLETIFSPYYSKDRAIKDYIQKFPFEKYGLYRVQNESVFYVDDIFDCIKSLYIKKGIPWEEGIHDVFKEYVKPGSVALDIGGHMGTHALNLSRLVGDSGSVHVFEPQLKMFCELMINMKINHCENVTCYHRALGKEKKWVEMYQPKENFQGEYKHILNEGHACVAESPSDFKGDRTWMTVLDEFNFDNVSLIKIDVEGYEMDVLRGARETIKRNKPVMIIEIFSGPELTSRIEEIKSLGYNCFSLGGDDYLFLPDETDAIVNASSESVLETFKIQIPDYPLAFNPSIVRWKGKILLSFRHIPNENDPMISKLGLVWLNSNFEPISSPTILEGHWAPPHSPEDARLIVMKNRLFVTASDHEEPYDRWRRRMVVMEVTENDNQFQASPPICLNKLQGMALTPMEKNWTPFVFRNHLLMSYSINPHRVLQPVYTLPIKKVLFHTPQKGWRWDQLPGIGLNDHALGQCLNLCTSGFSGQWEGWELRGGTPAELKAGEYLGFFHAVKWIDDVLIYTMGAYTFSASPPFSITKISVGPITHPSFYDGERKEFWTPMRVVFPGGWITKGDDIWITYGKNDDQIWMAKLSYSKLMKDMVPIN